MTVDQDDVPRYSPPPPYERQSSPPPPSSSSDNTEACSNGQAEYTPLSKKTTAELTMLDHRDPNNPFAFTTRQLSDMLEKRDVDFVHQLGGIEAFARGLHSSTTRGICDTSDPLPPITLHNLAAASTGSPNTTKHSAISAREQRTAVFGTNILPQVQGVSIVQLMWISLQDKTLILLIIAAVVSLIVGLYEDTTSVEYDLYGNRIMGVKWVEGVAIILAVALVVIVGSVNDYQKEKQFRKLNAKKQDRQVNAIRFGHSCVISIHDIQVGDVLRLEPGDVVAADGVFIQGSNLKCDESATTGESEAVRKARIEECIAMRWLTDQSSSASPSFETPTLTCLLTQGNDMLFDDFAFSDNISDMQQQLPDPFLISGSKVLEGVCTYIVTNVGVNSTYGKTMMALRTKDENTPLQDKLDILAGNIAKYGVAAAGFLFVVLLIQCILGYSNAGGSKNAADVVYQIMHILITTVTVVVVAVPEGLPLAVTLALAYATQRMLKDNNLVRVLAACETMGNATTICTDKTGTITQNKMSVVAGTFGSSFRFLKDPPPTRADLVDLCNLRQQMPLPVRNIINQAIALNSTAFKSTSSTGETTLVGNKTEMAMLNFAQDYLASEPLEFLRSRWHIEQVFPFNATQKAMGSVVRVPIIDKNTHQERIVYRLHVKGASESLLKKSSHIVSMHAESYKRFRGIQQGNCYDVETRPMTTENRERISKVIQSYATRCMRTLAICYQDFEVWPSNQRLQDVLAAGQLTLLGVVGIEDPLRPGVKSAVAACQRAGVYVRMVTGDNMLTAKSIARQCGIYTKGGIAMDGPTFRNLTYSEQLQVLPRLCVLARTTPEDKRLLVDRLRELREIVAVTGDGTNDGPALKAADVGFSMGVTGTEVAKEASSIIIMDDNFSSIVQAISWGRCVNDSVKKFLQFQITVNITAVILTIVSAITSAQQRSVLTAVQLLWVNLIMDTFAALALATDPPTPNLLERLPEPRTAPLINPSMWKMIIGQAIFQICTMLVLLYTDILDLKDDIATLQTLVFTTFVFCQIFNEVNCRRIDNQYNIVKGILDNKFFVIIFVLTIVVQVIIVQYGGTAFQTTPLDVSYWLLSIALGSMSIPIGALIRAIPNQVLTRKSNTISPRLRKVFMPDESRLVWNSVSLHDMQTIRNRHRQSFHDLQGSTHNEEQASQQQYDKVSWSRVV